MKETGGLSGFEPAELGRCEPLRAVSQDGLGDGARNSLVKVRKRL